ncbi:MAG: hypothetical protein ACYC3P_12395, partial [Bellilinea sp.]
WSKKSVLSQVSVGWVTGQYVPYWGNTYAALLPNIWIILKCRITGCCGNHPIVKNFPPSIRPTQTGETGVCIAPGLENLLIKPG